MKSHVQNDLKMRVTIQLLLIAYFLHTGTVCSDRKSSNKTESTNYGGGGLRDLKTTDVKLQTKRNNIKLKWGSTTVITKQQ